MIEVYNKHLNLVQASKQCRNNGSIALRDNTSLPLTTLSRLDPPSPQSTIIKSLRKN